MLDRVRERLATASDLYHDDVLILRPLLELEYPNNSTGLHTLLPELLRLMRSNLTYVVIFTNHVLDAPPNEVSRTLKDDLLRAVAQDLGEVSIDMREYGAIERQLALFEEKKQDEPHQIRPLAKLSAPALGLFTKHFYNLGLYKPIEILLTHLQIEIAHGHSIEIHTLYVPYLQELIGLMLMYGVPMTNVTYRSFFESVLRSYFELFVGQEPAQKHREEHEIWTKRAHATRCSLESFDHSYFRDILGDRYDNDVLPALMRLPGPAPGSHAHSRFDSIITLSTTGNKASRALNTTEDHKIDPALTASTIPLVT